MASKKLELDSKTAFNLMAKKNSIWAKKIGLKKEGGKGSQGPFYWIGNKLKVMTYPPNEYDTMDHTDFWEALVDSDVAPSYNIKDPNLIKKIKNLPYGFQRGRVAVMPSRSGQKIFAIYYGEGENLTDVQKKKIIEGFDLAAQFQAGLVKFIPDEHEACSQSDKARLKSLLSIK